MWKIPHPKEYVCNKNGFNTYINEFSYKDILFQ